MDLGSSNLNPSSLIDLKAELHKKYESFRKAKLSSCAESPSFKPSKRKANHRKEKVKQPKPIVKPTEENEEECALEKSRLALEAKAKLYEKIVSSNILIDDDQNETYLVDFQRKVLYNSALPKNVTTEDKGICNASDTVASTPAPFSQNTIIGEDNSASEVSPPKNTGSETEINDFDHPIHYQNIQHNEVRDHGTGYFAFSTNEAKRKEQMEELISLRQETQDQRANKQRILQKRKAMLQNRLAKICERKNIDQSVIEAFVKTDSDHTDETQPQEIDISSIPLPETKSDSVKKEPKIRPWDIGKDNLQQFVPEKNKIKSQNEWMEEKRGERKAEFAPPSSYVYSKS